jgi:hypothetical protein
MSEIQAITCNEFLPAALGEGALNRYDGYDSTVNPSVANESSAAAFHMRTLMNDDMGFFGNDGRAVFEEDTLAEAFDNPDLLCETGIDSILKYLASTLPQEFDNQIVDSLRNFLFGRPGEGGFDRASLNAQRGPDHGLADYNAVRVAYGLSPVDSFDDISSDPAIQQALQDLYGDVDDIDLWVGGLAEDHVRHSSFGVLIRTIVASQFERLRDGDRFWYEDAFSSRDVHRLKWTTLADVIERNTGVSNLQDNVFFMEAEVCGTVFLDRDGNGRQGFREPALAFIVVELLDDEGEVIATTLTNSDGRYQFDEFQETGDFQVRIIVPPFLQATTTNPVDVLISRGELTISGVDFCLKRDFQEQAIDVAYQAVRDDSGT